MSNAVDLQKIEHAARRVFGEDGLTYLFMGVLLFLIGLSFYDEIFAALGGLAALLIFPVKALRERITYPRVGYVEFSAPAGMARGMITFMVVAIACLVFVAFAANGRFQHLLPFLIAIVFALSMYFGASMNGVRLRDWAAIGLMLVSGMATTLLIDDWRMATAMQMWITAVLLIIMGTVDLIRFIRKYPVIEEATT